MRFRAFVWVLGMAGLLVSCGYELVRYRGALGDVRRVAIQTPRNDSFDPGIERVVADSLRQEFLRRGSLEVVEDPGAADLLITGIVLPIETRGQSFSSIAFSLEFETTLSLDLHVTRPDGSEVALDPRALTTSELYLASADVEVTRKNREEALRRMADVLAGRVHDSLFVKFSP